MNTKLQYQHKPNNSIMLFLFGVLLIAHMAMLIAVPTENEPVERICSYVILFDCYIMFIYSYFVYPYVNVRDLLFLMMVGYLVILSALFSWQYDDYKVTLVFLSMMTVWRAMQVISCTPKIEKALLYVFSLQGLLLIGLFFSPIAYKGYQAYVEVASELTLGYPNPNQTGIIIFSTLAILLILVRRHPLKKGYRYFIWAEILALSVFLLLTKARTSLAGFLMFLFFFFRKKNIKINEKIAGLIICFPILFVYLYDLASNSAFKDLKILGKKVFSGRQRVFQNVLQLCDNKVLGKLTYFQFQNSHNALLTILVNIGIIGLILYLLFTISSFNELNRKNQTEKTNLGLIAVLSLFIMGCAEAAGLTGGSIYSVYLLVLLILAQKDISVKEG